MAGALGKPVINYLLLLALPESQRLLMCFNWGLFIQKTFTQKLHAARNSARVWKNEDDTDTALKELRVLNSALQTAEYTYGPLHQLWNKLVDHDQWKRQDGDRMRQGEKRKMNSKGVQGFSTLFVTGTNSTLFVSRTFLPRMIYFIYLLFSSPKTEFFCEDLAVLNSRYRSG